MMKYEYKCPCGGEFNKPGCDIGRREENKLFWQCCPFCLKRLNILPPGYDWDTHMKIVQNERKTEKRTAEQLAINPPRFHKRVLGKECCCDACNKLRLKNSQRKK